MIRTGRDNSHLLRVNIWINTVNLDKCNSIVKTNMIANSVKGIFPFKTKKSFDPKCISS